MQIIWTNMVAATEPAEVGGRLGSPLTIEEANLPTCLDRLMKDGPVDSRCGAGWSDPSFLPALAGH